MVTPMVRKEFRQIRRDPTSLGMLLVLPSVLIIMAGYALDFDVKHVPLAVLDLSRTPESRRYLERFRNTEYVDYLIDAGSYRDVEDLLVRGRVRCALVLPVDFASAPAAGRDVTLQILLDGSDANSAGQASAFLVRATADYTVRLATVRAERSGRRIPVPLEVRPRVWYNPDLLSSQFLIPGLIGFILVLTAVVSTSLTVVREKERGTMEQLVVSPLRPAHIILGKTIPYMGISLVAATGILVLGYLLFGVQVKGSLLILYAAFLTIILGALGQGLLISTVTGSQQVAFMISVFSSLLPSFLLSGFVFPVASMPPVLQALSNLAVNKFFLIVVRGVMQKGVGIASLWEQFVFMLVFAAVMLTASAWRMKRHNT
ncbi:MAG: ABC transporter permease [Bacteroidota bacterium]